MRVKAFQRIFPLVSKRTHARGPMIAADHLARLLDRPLDAVCKNGALLAEGLLTAGELYRSDLLIVFSDISVEAEAMGVEVEYSRDRNPHITTQLAPRDVVITDMSNSGRIPELLRAAEICRKELDSDFPIFFSIKDPFSLAALVMGSEAFLIALVEEPQVVCKLLDVCCESQQSLVEVICAEGYIPFVGAPISSGGLIGPDWFRKFAQPYLDKIFTWIREADTPCCMHICGEVNPLMEQLPALNLDMLSFEEWFSALWEKMPNTVPMGYVPTDLFARGSAETIERATLESFNNLPKPFVLSTACDLPANANPKLVQRMMQVEP